MSILTEAVVILAGDASPLDAAITRAVSSVEEAGKRLQAVGNKLSLKVSLPLAGIGAASTLAAAEFDKSMRATAALTQFTTKQVEGLRDGVRDMGAEFGQGANAAADALFFLATPSLTAAQNMAILRESLRGAAIGLGEAKDIALGVVGAMNAYADSGLTAARATEILAAGTKFGRFEAAELVPQLGRLTGFASAMGVEFEDLIGTMSVLTLTGASTAEAATSLSAILSTLAGTSSEGEKLLGDFGLSMAGLRDAAAGPGGLINVLRMLDEATGGNIEQLEAIFPNIRALRGAMIALAQDSRVVDDTMMGVRNSVGLMDEALAASEGSMHALRQAMSRMQDAAISIGDALSPVVIPAITAFTKMLQALGRILDGMPVGLKAVVVLFGAIAFAMGPVISLMGSIIAMAPGWLLLWLAIRRVSGSVITMSTAVPTLGAAWAALNAKLAGSSLTMHLLTLRAFALGKVLPLLRAGLLAIVTSPFFIVSALLVAAFAAWVQAGVAVKENWGILKYEAGRFARRLGFLRDEMKEVKQGTEDTTRALLEWARAGFPEGPEQKRDPAPEWLGAAREASEALSQSLRVAQDRSRLLGEEFDLTGAQASAYDEVVRALTEANVDFNAKVGPQGETLRGLANEFLNLKNRVEEAQRQMELGKVSTEFAENLNVIRNSAQLLGPSFDEAGAKIRAYEQAINDALSKNMDFNAVIGPQGQTLANLAAELSLLKEALGISAEAYGNFNSLVSEGKRLAEQAAGPWEVLKQQAIALQAAYDAGVITFQQFFEALQQVQEAAQKAADNLEGVKGKTSALEQGLVDLTTRGIDRFVDSIFDAQQSFKDFVRQTIIEVSKLITKLLLLRLIAGEDGSIFGIKLPGFARGGFLGPGQLGIVGENGPEIVSGGRGGMRITPVAVSGDSSSSGEAMNLTVVNQVQAIDAQGVGRFFEENEPLVAGAMLRAMQRSTALRRRLAGG